MVLLSWLQVPIYHVVCCVQHFSFPSNLYVLFNGKDRVSFDDEW